MGLGLMPSNAYASGHGAQELPAGAILGAVPQTTGRTSRSCCRASQLEGGAAPKALQHLLEVEAQRALSEDEG